MPARTSLTLAVLLSVSGVAAGATAPELRGVWMHATQVKTPAQADVAVAKIERANMAAIKPPSDGKYLGDWKRGEQIAQRGTGFQYSDTKDTPVGGNCYACHQLTKAEISYGTIGPSLYNFGKIRGFTPEMQQYAWGKVWNTQAYSACSFMPRFGHAGILTEAQVKDVVALLMDPSSPVNQ